MGSDPSFEVAHPDDPDLNGMTTDRITLVETTTVWSAWWDDLANQMFSDWNSS